MIKQKGIIVLILLVIVLLVAYVFYTRYYKGLVKEHFSSQPRHHPDSNHLYTPYPEIRFFNKHDYLIKTKIFKECEHRIPTEGSSMGLEFIKKNFYV